MKSEQHSPLAKASICRTLEQKGGEGQERESIEYIMDHGSPRLAYRKTKRVCSQTTATETQTYWRENLPGTKTQASAKQASRAKRQGSNLTQQAHRTICMTMAHLCVTCTAPACLPAALDPASNQRHKDTHGAPPACALRRRQPAGRAAEPGEALRDSRSIAGGSVRYPNHNDIGSADIKQSSRPRLLHLTSFIGHEDR